MARQKNTPGKTGVVRPVVIDDDDDDDDDVMESGSSASGV